MRRSTLAWVALALALCLAAPGGWAAPYDALVLGDSPYAYWRLGELAGTTAFDAAPAGGAQNGSYAQFAPPDGVPTIGVAGIPGGGGNTAAEFHGTSPVSQVYVADTASPAAYTIEAWIKADTGATTGRNILVRAAGDPRSTYSHSLRINNDGLLENYTYAGGARYVWDSAAVQPDQWYHVVGLAREEHMELYVNGERKALASWGGGGAPWTGGNQWRIGAVSGDGTFRQNPTNTLDWFDGTIDEVAVYHHELSDAQILDHYRAGMGITPEDFDGDGVSEMAQIRSDGSVAIYDASLPGGSTTIAGVQATQITAADLDGNGTAEIAFINMTTNALQSYSLPADATTTHPFPSGYTSIFTLSAGNTDGAVGDELMVAAGTGRLFVRRTNGTYVDELIGGNAGDEFVVRAAAGAPYVYNYATNSWAGLGGALDQIATGNLFPSDDVDEIYARNSAGNCYVHNNGGWRGPAGNGFAPAVGRVDDDLADGQEQAFVIGSVNQGNIIYQSRYDWSETGLGAYTALKTDASNLGSADAADNWGWSDLLVADIDTDGRAEVVAVRRTATSESLHVFNNGDVGFVKIADTGTPFGNVALDKPVIGGTGAYSASFAAQKAVDGRVDETFGQSYWLGRNGVANESFTVDLLGLHDIEEIVLRNTHNGSYNDRGTMDFRVLASSDNATFTPILTGTLNAVTGVNGETTSPVQLFDVDSGLTPTQARYLRFETLSSTYPNNNVGLTEMMVSSERNVALGAPVIEGSSAYNGAPFDQGQFPARYITDGNPADTSGASFWLGTDGQANEHLTLDLGQARDVMTIALRNTHNGSYNDRGTRDFRIWASNAVDGSNQLVDPVVILESTLSTSLGGNMDTLLPTDTFSNATGLAQGSYRYLMFETLSSSFGNNFVGLNEIQVFEGIRPANVAAGKPIIKASGSYDGGADPINAGLFPASKVTDMQLDEQIGGSFSYWLGRNGVQGEYFILDLGEVYSIEGFELQNTHNRTYNDRGTAGFEIWAAMGVDASNELIDPKLVLEGVLPDRFGAGNDIPFDVFYADEGDFDALWGRYIQFTATSYWGVSAGLNEIRVLGTIPEPATLALVGLGLLALVRRRRRA